MHDCGLLIPRVYKTGKKVSNALYTFVCTVCNMYVESDVTSCLVHVTVQSTEKRTFTPTLKSRGFFRAFSDRFCLYAHFCHALSMFSLVLVLVHAALEATPTIKAAQLIGQY